MKPEATTQSRKTILDFLTRNPDAYVVLAIEVHSVEAGRVRVEPDRTSGIKQFLDHYLADKVLGALRDHRGMHFLWMMACGSVMQVNSSREAYVDLISG